VQHLEQEVKLEVGPDWSLPDLSGALPGAQAIPIAPVDLEATYYDTADQRLTARHITMRYRRESEDAGPKGRGRARQVKVAHIWTVKLPSTAEGAALSRTEVSWDAGDGPAGGGRGAGPAPLADAVQFVAGITLGEPLRPIARLVTARRRTEVRTSDGRVLAEIDHDTVTGTNLVPPPGGGEPGPPVSFTEVEVELAEGSALEVLDAVASKLVAAGARYSARKGKLMTVLAQHPAYASAALGTATAPKRRWRGTATMASVLQEQARTCLDVLVEHDPAIRLSDPDPEHVHRSRVATRRLRSVLRAFGPLVDNGAGTWPSEAGVDLGALDAEAWFAALNRELGWLGKIMGHARDADVRVLALEEACAQLGPKDVTGAASIMQAAQDEQRAAHEDLRQVMATERYRVCLRAVEALGRSPWAPAAAEVPVELWGRLAQPAATGMPALGRREWRALRKAVRRLGKPPSDEALHKVRIHAKRVRYISELAAPVLRLAVNRRAADRTVKTATELQDVLGHLHDEAVNEQWLRDLSSRPAGSAHRARPQAAVPTALAAGQLVALARQSQQIDRRAWLPVWGRLDDKKTTGWLGAGGADKL
jgi:CHAD domain-containing protein